MGGLVSYNFQKGGLRVHAPFGALVKIWLGCMLRLLPWCATNLILACNKSRQFYGGFRGANARRIWKGYISSKCAKIAPPPSLSVNPLLSHMLIGGYRSIFVLHICIMITMILLTQDISAINLLLLCPSICSQACLSIIIDISHL